MYAENLYKRNKHLSVPTKTECKKPHNNWKSVSLWQRVFRELRDSHTQLCCCTVHWRQKSLITELQTVLIVTDSVQEQKMHIPPSYTAKCFVEVRTHWKFFCCNGEYQQLLYWWARALWMAVTPPPETRRPCG